MTNYIINIVLYQALQSTSTVSTTTTFLGTVFSSFLLFSLLPSSSNYCAVRSDPGSVMALEIDPKQQQQETYIIAKGGSQGQVPFPVTAVMTHTG